MNTSSPDQARLEAIWASVVDKMKEVVREHRVTQEELHLAGDFMNRLGQSGMCRSVIDMALAMTSVDALQQAAGGTRPNLEGPYFAAHPERPSGELFDAPPGPDAPRLDLSGVVTEATTGAPVPGAKLDFWQADHRGVYDRAGSYLRGVVFADADGCYSISTVLPNDYSEHDHDPIGELFRAMGRHNTRAAHIHVKASTGGVVRLTTQIFMPTSSFIERDYVEGAVTPDLIAPLTTLPQAEGAAPRYQGRFDIVLPKPGHAGGPR